MFALRAKEKPKYARLNSDDFYYRDHGRKDCEGIENATKFSTRENAEVICNKFQDYEIVESD